MSLRSLLTVVAPPLCAGCGASAGGAEPLCAECRQRLRWLDHPLDVDGLPVWAGVVYEGGARALVHALKFRGVPRIARTMAAQMVAAAPLGLIEEATLVPVPIHPARLRRRGFNQAALLAGELAERSGTTVADCLERAGPHRTQIGRGRAERRESIAVRLRGPAPPRALLVDDVITTGATLAACAAALGPGCAGALVYAHTPGK
jgi:ComF family protein